MLFLIRDKFCIKPIQKHFNYEIESENKQKPNKGT